MWCLKQSMSFPPTTMLPLASTPPPQAKPSSITSSSDQQARAYVFMEPLNDIDISRQLEEGKQHLTGTKQHKHSMRVSPRYAFAALLLNAAAKKQREPPQQINGQISKHSIHIHKRLCQITAEFEITTRTAALTFNYWHCYQQLTPAIIEVLKRLHSLPWAIILNDQLWEE